MRRSMLAALIVALAACGPKHAAPPGDVGNGTDAPDAGVTSDAAPPEKPKQLSRAECEQMIDHVLEIGMAQQRASKPAEYVPTPEQVAQIRAGLVADQLPACLAWSRAQWHCVMSATEVHALYACADESAPPPSAPPPTAPTPPRAK